MKSGKGDKSYLRSLQAEAWSSDSMPKKSVKKWKRKERQKAKNQIRKEIKES